MTRWPALFACAALLAACDPGGGDDDPEPTPDMMVDAMPDMAPEPEPEPDAAPMPGVMLAPDLFRVPAIGPDQTVERTVRLTNTGNITVQITGFALEEPEGFQLLYRLGERRPIIAISFAGQDVGSYPLLVEPGGTLDVILEHRPVEAGVMPSGAVVVMTDLPEGDITIPIEAAEAVGQIAVDPPEVVFGRVPPGEMAEQTIEVSNAGQAPLTIQAIQLQGDMDFSVTADGADPQDILADPDGDGTPGLAPGGDFTLTVSYAPAAEGLDEAQLSIVSDDPQTPDVRIPLSGNDTTGCILVDPGEMFTIDYMPGDMDISAEVTVENCGGQPLTVDNIRFRAGTPPEVFAFADDSLPEFPATLEPGSDPLVVTILVTPTEARVFRGALQIFSNDPEQPEIAIEFQAVPPGGGMDGGGDGGDGM